MKELCMPATKEPKKPRFDPRLGRKKSRLDGYRPLPVDTVRRLIAILEKSNALLRQYCY